MNRLNVIRVVLISLLLAACTPTATDTPQPSANTQAVPINEPEPTASAVLSNITKPEPTLQPEPEGVWQPRAAMPTARSEMPVALLDVLEAYESSAR